MDIIQSTEKATQWRASAVLKRDDWRLFWGTLPEKSYPKAAPFSSADRPSASPKL
ncbi:hypothetical protein H4R35_002502 [Dimargaris xerosporica]|nr:hypothetical protein H4R35_002502 [Dimargaris xerosporica]